MMPTQPMKANHRCNFAPVAQQEFGRVFHAPSFLPAAVAYFRRWAVMRAERTKRKSWSEHMNIVRGKRGTSAALGERQKQNISPFFWFVAPGGAPNQKKGKLGGGVVYPGRQSLRSLAPGCYLAAPPGRRTGGQAVVGANQRPERTPGSWLVRVRGRCDPAPLTALLAAWLKRTRALRFIQIVVVALVGLALRNLATGGEIQEATKQGDLEKVKALLKENPALAFSKDDTGWTPLHLAAQKGFREIAELLLANKARVNAKSKRGDMPLHWAAVNGHKEVARLLLANKADVNAHDNGGWTPLHMAALGGYNGVLELLLANGAQINPKDKEGMTPFGRAMAQGHRDAAELLRQHGVRA
jgi:hypothetical protein